MFNMGGGELFVIALIALLVVKPDKLPGLATSVGRWIGELNRSLNEVKRAVSAEHSNNFKSNKNLQDKEASPTHLTTDKDRADLSTPSK